MRVVTPVGFVKSDPAGNLPDPRSHAYLIDAKTPTPHVTFATAQVLRKAPYSGVIGRLNPAESIDLFRVPIDTKTSAVHFNLRVEHTSPSTSQQLLLFDESGNELGESPSSGDGSDLTLRIDLVNPKTALSLFVGVKSQASVDQVPSPSTPSIAYRVLIAQDITPGATGIAPPQSGNSNPAAPASTPAPIPIGLPLIVPPAVGALPSVGDGPVRPIKSQLDFGTGPRLVPVGLLTLLTAEPAGGLLADGDSIPADIRTEDAMVHLDGPEVFAPDESRKPTDVASAEVTTDPAAEASDRVRLPGPGGFPLLGAALIGDWRGTSARGIRPQGARGRASAPTGQVSGKAHLADAVTALAGRALAEPPKRRREGESTTLATGLKWVVGVAFAFASADLTPLGRYLAGNRLPGRVRRRPRRLRAG